MGLDWVGWCLDFSMQCNVKGCTLSVVFVLKGARGLGSTNDSPQHKTAGLLQAVYST